jgi:hypothetical protein
MRHTEASEITYASERRAMTDRRELTRQYKETPRPAGVYRVQHRSSGRILLGSSVDAPAMLNRIRAQLRMKGHPNRTLQRDWNTDGPDAFEFEVIDLLAPSTTPTADPTDDLAMLEALWREKLGIADDASY